MGAVSENSELHVFCDVSMKAYGGVAYARNVNGETCLLTAKLRIAPCKKHTLTTPRLEPMALLVGARLAKYLSQNFKFSKVTIRGDSKVAVAWVGSKIENKSTIIANRAWEVSFSLQECEFELQHVSAKENPADVLSREADLKQLHENSLWAIDPAYCTSQDPWQQLMTHETMHLRQ
ncbi:uncharacterized protein [Macrobrachium rosenbergii]|uniref:uncharacterized protein n=1 Tax=Macrobrachium rosenbergii TaxID=79674 RepID=UPI0034D694FE